MKTQQIISFSVSIIIGLFFISCYCQVMDRDKDPASLCEPYAYDCSEDCTCFFADIEVQSKDSALRDSAAFIPALSLHGIDHDLHISSEEFNKEKEEQHYCLRYCYRPKKVSEKAMLVVEAEAHVSQYMRINPVSDCSSAPLALQVNMYPTENFDQDISNRFRMKVKDQDLSVTLPPADVSKGKVRLFNPLSDGAAIPPLFDSRGRMIAMASFSSVLLLDAENTVVSSTDGNTVLRMNIPRAMWPSLIAIEPGTDFIEPGTDFIEPGTDFIEPGTDFIEPGTDFILPQGFSHDTPLRVPFYAFDTGAGNWTLSSVGDLEDSWGNSLTAESLESIWRGEFEGSLVASARVPHFSFWGLAWPKAGNACVSGVLEVAEEEYLDGITITVQGKDHPISVEPVITDKIGQFCISLPQPADEKEYSIRLFASRVVEYASGISNIRHHELGDVIINREVSDGCCDVGKCAEFDKRSLQDRGIPSWLQEGFIDDNIESPYHDADQQDILDLKLDRNEEIHGERIRVSIDINLPACRENCDYSITPEPDSINSEKLDEAIIISIPGNQPFEIIAAISSTFSDNHEITESGRAFFDRTDMETVDLKLDNVSERRPLNVAFDIEYDDCMGPNTPCTIIKWEPDLRAEYLEVKSEDGSLKWAIAASGDNGDLNQVEYGVARESLQLYPYNNGRADALREGDRVEVYVNTVNERGFRTSARGGALYSE